MICNPLKQIPGCSNNVLDKLFRLPARFNFVVKPYCLAFAFAASAQVNAFELDFTGFGGIDTNPLALSDQHNPDSDLFLYGDINFSADYDKRFFIDAYTQQTVFIDDDRADWSRSKLDLGYKSKFKIGERRIRYEFSTDVTDRDKTYVSKTTGEEATFGGESIEDRYDYVSQNYNAMISYRNQQRIKFKLEYQFRDKDYDDFTDLGLSDFDYEHDRLRLSIDIPVAESGRFVGRVGTTDREFKDKRADDLNGDDIPDSDLEYDYDSYELDYYYRPSKTFRFSALLDYVTRSDNAVGYADTTYQSLALSGKYSLSDNETLEVSIRFSNYEYDNRNVTDELSLEEDEFDQEIQRIILEYEKVLSSADDRELTSYLSLEIFDVESTDARYEYDRNIIAAGVRYGIR